MTSETAMINGAMEEIRIFLKQVTDILSDLFQSGFQTVHDSTLKEMEAAAARGRQYGMDTLASLLTQLQESLQKQRHQMMGEDRSPYAVYGTLNQYVYLCKKRLETDQAEENLTAAGAPAGAEESGGADEELNE